MLNKFRRSIRKYLIFSSVVALTVLGFLFLYLTRTLIGNVLLIFAAIIGIINASNRSLDILRHGYYGIQLLPITAAVFALLLREPPTAAVLAIVLTIEEPFFGKNKSGLFALKHAPLIKTLDKAVLPYTVLIFLIAGGIWTYTREPNRFLEVLAVASTAPLLVAAPLVIKNNMNALIRKSIKVKSARFFELLSDSTAIIFRKTGVLTESELQLKQIYTFGKNTKSQVIEVAAALAYNSTHSISASIISYVENTHKINRAKHTTTVIGEGIVGRKKGSELIVGRYSFLESKGVIMPSKVIDDKDLLIYVASGGVCIGAISFSEARQTNLKELSHRLKRLGYTTIEVVSGSSNKSTAHIAKAAGLTQSYGDLSITTIISRVQESSNDSPTVFVGSDEQDEAVLPLATVGVSANPNVVSASAEIQDYSLGALLDLLDVSKKTFRLSRLLALGALALTLMFVVITVTGRIPALYAALANLAITVLILLLATDLKAPQQQPKE